MNPLLVIYVNPYLEQSLPTPGEPFFDIDWFLSHGLSPLLFVFLVHCESRDTFAQRASYSRDCASRTTWKTNETLSFYKNLSRVKSTDQSTFIAQYLQN